MNFLKNLISKPVAFIKRRKKTSILLALILVLIIWGINGGKTKAETYTVERGDLSVIVKATGNIKPSENATLSFGKGGNVSAINVKAGDKVTVGQELARLNLNSLNADLLRAQSAFNEASISSGRTVRESQGQNLNAWTKAVSAINDAYSKEDDALRNDLDKYFKNPGQYNTYIELTYYTSNIPTEQSIEINSLRYKAEQELVNFKRVIDEMAKIPIGGDTTRIDGGFEIAKKNLVIAQELLNKVANSVNGIFDDTGPYKTYLQEYKTNISSARDQVSTSLDSLNASRDEWLLAPKSSNGSLDAEGVATAQIEQKRAEVSSIEAQIRDSKIVSPLNGVVSRKEISLGETVSAGEEAFFVLADDDFYIEANVSEINIGKVALDNVVDVTLDAYPDKVFKGKLIYIEDSETIVDGIVNYKIRVYVEVPKELARSGLTANLSIFASTKGNVLKAPIYYFTKDGEDMIALVKTEKGEESKKIRVGFKGSDGFVEVLSGLKLGEVLVLPKPAQK